jgi:hypothetical protein
LLGWSHEMDRPILEDPPESWSDSSSSPALFHYENTKDDLYTIVSEYAQVPVVDLRGRVQAKVREREEHRARLAQAAAQRVKP